MQPMRRIFGWWGVTNGGEAVTKRKSLKKFFYEIQKSGYQNFISFNSCGFNINKK
jgi:hypothetical protein